MLSGNNKPHLSEMLCNGCQLVGDVTPGASERVNQLLGFYCTRLSEDN